MKKNFAIILLFLTVNIVYSQERKSTVFLDYLNKKITKKEFKKLRNNNTYTQVRENDSLIMKKILYKEKTLSLDSVKFGQIQKFLSQIIGPQYQLNRNTMIHLFDSNGLILKESLENKKYWSWIKKHQDEFQAYLIGTKTSGIKRNSKYHLFLDPYNLLKNLFFKDSDFEINHLFIKPNGIIIIYHGGNDTLMILDSSV